MKILYSQSKNTKTVQNFSEPIKKITCIVMVLLVLLVIDAAAAAAILLLLLLTMTVVVARGAAVKLRIY